MKVYDFLSSSLRTLDTNGVLERYLGAVQAQADYTENQIRELSRLRSISRASDEEVQFITALLGWDGAGGTDFIGDDTNTLRRFAKFGPELWGGKGTKITTERSLSSLVGVDVSSRDSFQLRAELDRTTTAEGGWTRMGMILDQTIVEDDLEASGLPRDALSVSPLSWAHIYIDASGVTSEIERIIFDLLQFMRPVSVCYLVVYCASRSTFIDGSTGRLLPVSSDALPFASDLVRSELEPSFSPDPSDIDFDGGGIQLKGDRIFGFLQSEGSLVLNEGKTLTILGTLGGRSGQFSDRRIWSFCVRIPDGSSTESATLTQVVYTLRPTGLSVSLYTAREGSDGTPRSTFMKTLIRDLPFDPQGALPKLLAKTSVSALPSGSVSVEASFAGGETFSIVTDYRGEPNEGELNLERASVGVFMKGFDFYGLTCLSSETKVQPIYDSTAFPTLDIFRA